MSKLLWTYCNVPSFNFSMITIIIQRNTIINYICYKDVIMVVIDNLYISEVILKTIREVVSEIAPDITRKVIREEIEKIKKQDTC